MKVDPKPVTRGTRALHPRDLEAVVAIDTTLSGRARRAYFERRLAAAQREPERHAQLAIEHNGKLAGFMLGRLLEGEFGRAEPELRLEALGIAREAQGRGLGRTLCAAFEDEAVRRGASLVRTTALWRQHSLLGFFDRAGFTLAPVHVLERPTALDLAPESRDRFEAAVLEERDIDGIARIDRRYTGRDRRGYLCRTLREGLADSAVRISLAVRVDGGVAGYLMARMDFGDYGRAEPAAVIDTVGVDPLRAREGIGRALVSQLLLNLSAIGAERAETAVAAGDLALMGFFCRNGFRPSERLAFLKRLA